MIGLNIQSLKRAIKMQTKLLIQTEKINLKTKNLAKAVYKTLKQKEKFLVELVFLSENEIQKLNLDSRGIDKVTDVLSFPTLENVRNKIINKKDFPYDLIDGKRIFLGSIAICEKRAKEQAKEYGHSEERELTYLLCHGLLHLFGYDHMIEEDKREMRFLEDEIMNKIRIFR